METDKPFLVITIAGQTGSGKTTLARNLSQLLNADFYSFGSFVHIEAVHRGIRVDRSSLQQLGQALIKDLGPDEFVRRVLNLDRTEGGMPTVSVLDGVRSIEIWKSVQKLSFRSILIYLDIDEDIRIERILKRDNVEVSAVQLVMNHAMEMDVPTLQKYADMILYNSPSDMMVSNVLGLLTSKGYFSDISFP